MKAVILAGGRGTQLVPYPYILPKPLMPIDGMPILEVLLRQLKRSGIEDITLTVGRHSQLFEAFFQNGTKWGLNLGYSLENEPLGTAGTLSLIKGLDQTFLVANGDVLTDLEFGSLFKFHHKMGGIATLAVHQRQVRIDMGIVQTDHEYRISNYVEKPVNEYLASIGMNVFEPRIMEYIPTGQYLDFPDLVLKLIAAGEKVVAYHFDGYWMDLGRPDDYQKASDDFGRLRSLFLKEE